MEMKEREKGKITVIHAKIDRPQVHILPESQPVQVEDLEPLNFDSLVQQNHQ